MSKPKYKINHMIKVIRQYTDDTQLPILKEVCLENEWNYIYVMQLQRENPVLAQAIRRLLTKKEVMLEKAMYAGTNNTACIFGLKQLGWKDNPDPVVVNNIVQENTGGNRSESLKKVSAETLEELESIYEEIEKSNQETKED